MLTGHQVSNIFFTMPKAFWDGLTRRGEGGDRAAEAAAKKFNDDGVLATRRTTARPSSRRKGITVTTPDVAAFRKQVLDAFLELATSPRPGPQGLLDRINAAGA